MSQIGDRLAERAKQLVQRPTILEQVIKSFTTSVGKLKRGDDANIIVFTLAEMNLAAIFRSEVDTRVRSIAREELSAWIAEYLYLSGADQEIREAVHKTLDGILKGEAES